MKKKLGRLYGWPYKNVIFYITFFQCWEGGNSGLSVNRQIYQVTQAFLFLKLAGRERVKEQNRFISIAR